MLGRPHKILDAAALEHWFLDNCIEIVQEWEYSDLPEWVDFWDWVSQEHSYEFRKFEKQWRKGSAN